MKNRREPIKVEYQTLVVVWAALLFSQLLFLVIIFLVKPELFAFDFAQPFFADQPMTIVVLAAAAIVLFVLSFIFRNQHLARAVADQDAGCVQTGLVLACALSEGCSLIGVLLALAFDYNYFFLWIGLGLIGILLHFPRKGNLEAASLKRN